MIVYRIEHKDTGFGPFGTKVRLAARVQFQDIPVQAYSMPVLYPPTVMQEFCAFTFRGFLKYVLQDLKIWKRLFRKGFALYMMEVKDHVYNPEFFGEQVAFRAENVLFRWDITEKL